MVWYYQILAQQEGLDTLSRYVRQFEYGSQETTGGIDRLGRPFWVDGTLGISANEQVDFLRRLYEGELGLTTRTTELTKDIMIADTGPRRAVMGAAWRFDEALARSDESSTVNTSFIERLNLTIRQSSAYLSRRTLSHARATDTLAAHLELLRCYYNFVRPHGALKFSSCRRSRYSRWLLSMPSATSLCIFTGASVIKCWRREIKP